MRPEDRASMDLLIKETQFFLIVSGLAKRKMEICMVYGVCMDLHALEGDKVFNVVPSNACTATGLKSYLCSGNASGWSRVESSSCSRERLGCLTEWRIRAQRQENDCVHHRMPRNC